MSRFMKRVVNPRKKPEVEQKSKYFNIPGVKQRMTYAQRCSYNERFNWKDLGCFTSGYYQTHIIDKLHQRREYTGLEYSPHDSQLLKPLELCPFNRTKVVFLVPRPWQDHAFNDGLCLSHPPHQKSRRKGLGLLFSEYSRDLGYNEPKTNHLGQWARQGVLMLNLWPICDKYEGWLPFNNPRWSIFIREILCQLSDKRKNIVFVLFGEKCQRFGKQVIFDQHLHCIINVPWTASYSDPEQLKYKRPFTKINKYLVGHKITPINWRLPSHGKNEGRRRALFRTTTSEKGKAWKKFQEYKAQRNRGKVVI